MAKNFPGRVVCLAGSLSTGSTLLFSFYFFLSLSLSFSFSRVSPTLLPSFLHSLSLSSSPFLSANIFSFSPPLSHFQFPPPSFTHFLFSSPSHPSLLPYPLPSTPPLPPSLPSPSLPPTPPSLNPPPLPPSCSNRRKKKDGVRSPPKRCLAFLRHSIPSEDGFRSRVHRCGLRLAVSSGCLRARVFISWREFGRVGVKRLSDHMGGRSQTWA